VSKTVCGLPTALSVTEILPSAPPETLGVNVTSMVQFAPAASVAPQVVVARKFVLATMFMIFSVPSPVLLRVTGCTLLFVPTTSCPNIRLLADNVTPGAAPGILLEQPMLKQIPIKTGIAKLFMSCLLARQALRDHGLVKKMAEGNPTLPLLG